MSTSPSNGPVIIVGGGLAGLVAASELSQRKIKSVIVDQENEKSLGGQAYWSLGGLFCVNSTEQRHLGIKDCRELAMSDWINSAAFDRDDKEDYWPRRWAEAFVNFATDEMEDFVKKRGLKFASVQWLERGGGDVSGHGNSVPRMHIAWGCGPEVVRIFAEPVKAASMEGLVEFKFRHRVDEIVVDDKTGAAVGVKGQILEPTDADRGVATSRKPTGQAFDLHGKAVLIASGGIGGNLEAIRKHWPVDRFGPRVPESFVQGVPAHVDGRMVDIAQKSGANIVNMDRMWHYTEGMFDWEPVWPHHGIRIIPGPSPLWLDATGTRLPPPLYPCADTLAALKYICSSGYDYSWFIVNRNIISREFTLSGSEQNPDLTQKSIALALQRIFTSTGTGPVQEFIKYGKDWIIRDSLEELVEGMNHLAGDEPRGPTVDLEHVKRQITLRDSQTENAFCKDDQIMLINNARSYWPDKLAGRVTKPHRILDPEHGPLVAVKLHLLTRKTLGGLEANLNGNAIRADGSPFPNLYSAGEVAGFGGGGVHGYRALEGGFLGGCIFSGLRAGRAIADLVSK